MFKNILGLDLGTNSIGWALIEHDDQQRLGKIIGSGSRIIPMSQDILGKFDSGQSISQTAERTNFRSVRRLRERQLLRRERLHRVLNIIKFLPEHYAVQIDFDKHFGQFKEDTEPKLAYKYNDETNCIEFLFKESFSEMLKDFIQYQPGILTNNKKIPYDWTIYYLRKKALKEKISKEELSWILLNFNQKRGYNQLRGEEAEENINKQVEYHSLKVIKVEATDDKKGDEVWYQVHLENGWIYPRKSRYPLDWVGKVKDFIVTADLNADGSIKTDKEGKEKRSFRSPAEDDWTLLKKKTEHDILYSGKTVGTYIYDALLNNPTQKIKGKLVRVIERNYYKEELRLILKKQMEYHPELSNEAFLEQCLEELYQYNDAHRENIRSKGFLNLFINDILFYQRPLKSKKSEIKDCPFESRIFFLNGVKNIQPLKTIAKSHPLYQEFRLWQFLQNLRIYEKEKLVDGIGNMDVNVTNEFLKTEEDWVHLFDWLNDKKEIDQKAFFKYPLFQLKNNGDRYRWNYVEDKFYPCNETKGLIQSRLTKVEGIPGNLLAPEAIEKLWHILYSVEDRYDLIKALKSFALANQFGEKTTISFIENLKKCPPFKKEYGAYSAKAIKKLLPLMRAGKYWEQEKIDLRTTERIDKIITGEFDLLIRDKVREKSITLKQLENFRGLPLWLTSYIVYNRHSENAENVIWHTPGNIQLLQQHSLRNPIVEQVINETLKVVKDIWNYYGKGEPGFFSEIHLELGREMKNPADTRKKLSEIASTNENTNLRIKALLQELLNDNEIENVRPYSPMQQEILRIYEEGALAGCNDMPEDILKITKQSQPSRAELIRYKLWLEQKYRSPYTGQIIPLNKLFTRAYDIEHIIPQSRYFDDSFSNKVICETEVNRDKDNCTGYEYMKNNSGKKIELSYGKEVTLFTVEEYEQYVKQSYSSNRGKMKRLLMEDIPEDFIQRQLNDSRYISKLTKSLLSNILRQKGEEESTSRNLIVTNGAITSTLKQDWGLNDIWNDLITPRFERLNVLTNSHNFGEWTNKNGKKVFQTSVPLELQKNFSKKRIDHRHHALDAIVIACTTRNHVNYLNNSTALEKGKTSEQRKQLRYDLKSVLCFKKFNTDSQQNNYRWMFYTPWESFTEETKENLEGIIVSFKQNLKVITKTVNYFQHWKKQADNEITKQLDQQLKGNWSIRKSLHKDTVSGLVTLKLKKTVPLTSALDTWQMISNHELKQFISNKFHLGSNKTTIKEFFKRTDYKWNDIDVSKVEVFYWATDTNGIPLNVASRVSLDENFNSNKISSITDTGIQAILMKHLTNFNEDKNGKITEHPELAFSPDGIEQMNRDMVQLNNGRKHQPIKKVRTYEPLGNKFAVGEKGNKKYKFVEAAKGTNLFFAIYVDENGKRSYETIPLIIIIERLKQGLTAVPEKNNKNEKLLYSLSPNDLVYIPGEEQINNRMFHNELYSHTRQIYKIVSFTGSRLYAIPHTSARAIVDKVEYTQLNKVEFSLDQQLIKQVCHKISCTRLGRLRTENISFYDSKGKYLGVPETNHISISK
jgi:CRISPR-associated endonuclease Csn1